MRAWPLLKRWLPRLLALGLLVFAFQRAGLANVWQSVIGADVPSMIASTLLVLPFIVVRAARWRVVLADLRIVVRLVEATRLYAIGLFIGVVTPGQAGDAIKAWYLAHRGESLAIGLLSCVLDRLFDVLVLTAIATTALVVFWPNQSGQWLLGGAIIVGVLAMLLFLARPGLRLAIVGLPGLRWLWTPLDRRIRRWPWGGPLLDSGLHGPTLLMAVVLTGLGFAVTMSRVYLAFHAVGIDLPLLTFLAVASVTVFASLVSVAGLGSREVALIAMLGPLGYGEDQAVAASVLILFLNFTNVLPGLVAWLGNPVSAKRADQGA